MGLKEIVTKKIKPLDKIEKPIGDFSEKYCQNIDFRTGIKSLPLIGSHLDNLFAYKGSKIIQERVGLFFRETEKRLNELDKEKIDKDFLESEENFYIFQKIYEQIIRSEEKEKVLYFKNILINSYKKENSDYYYKERFINIVSDLSVLHLKILKYYVESEEVFKKEHRDSPSCITSFHAIAQQFGLMEPQAQAFCNDLLRYNFLYDPSIGVVGYERGAYRITDHAFDFIRFTLQS